jgi:Ca-activated chloride channel homolog
MTTFDPNDERITAYILGDDSLSTDDRTAVAELLSTNADAQRFADELRAAASLAGKELATEAVPAMAPTANIETAVRKELARPAKSKGWMLFAQWAVAATLLVGVGYYFMPSLMNTNRASNLSLKTEAQAVKSARPSNDGTTPTSFRADSAGGGYGSPFSESALKASGGEPASGGMAADAPAPTPGANLPDGPMNGTGAFVPRKAAVPSHGGAPPSAGSTKEVPKWAKDLYDKEKSAAPIPDEPAIAYINPKAWEELSPSRTRSEAKEDASRSYAEKSTGVSGPAQAKPMGGIQPVTQGVQKSAGNVKLGFAEGDVAQKTIRERNLTVADPAGEIAKKSEPEVARRGAQPSADDMLDGVKVAAAKPAATPVPALPALNPTPKPGQTVAYAVDPLGTTTGIRPEITTDRQVQADVKLKIETRVREEERLQQVQREAKMRSFGANLADGFNREAYPVLKENDFLQVNQQNALSTFSIDVDTASYALVRKFLNQNTLPPPGAVRLEEMVNYFRYNYEGPKGETPFAAHLEITECPWNPEHRLARIALKGREIDQKKRPPSNLVFLVDVSGSMNEPNKLPLVKESLKLLVDQLGENDRVAIAVYASGSGLVLDSTNGSKKSDIVYAIDNLQPSGSTNGAAGIHCAYDAAIKGFIKGGTNRVILCTDGDFNVGVTSDDELVKLITEKAKSGVFLSTLAVGEGNLQDKKMMELSNKGNGNYGYLDSIKEAKKLLVEQMTGTLLTIAKDVKIQVEFNPQKVGAYRLLGYEKRMLKAEDFKDDKKDAGEIGAGHTITALYELVPAGKTSAAGKTDPLVFQKPAEPAKVDPDLAKAVCLVKLRYKQPDGDKSTEVKFPGVDEGKKYTQATEDFRFAAAAASFAMILRDSPYKGNATPASVLELAQAAKGSDPGGYRAEFIKLVERAKELKK